MANGKHAYQDNGEPLKFFEYKLQAAFLSPLPAHADLSSDRSRLELRTVKTKDARFPCIMVIPLMPKYPGLKDVPLGLFPTYCFDPQMPVLRASHDFGTLTANFNHIVKVQNRYIAKEITILDIERKILTAEVAPITGLNPSDPALTPPESAISKNDNMVQCGSGVLAGMIIKKTKPYYPDDAKDLRLSGTVVLEATIGRDGGIHNLRVMSAPSPSLAISALWAVSQWAYKP
jgi:TonB family protein